MATKKAKKRKAPRKASTKKNPAMKPAKPSGWMAATRVKFVRKAGGGMSVLIQKPKPKRKRR